MTHSRIKAGLAAAVLSLAAGEAFATDHRKNPFTLVYDGAITANEPGRVNIHPVTYKLNGLDIAANVYTPAGYSSDKRYATIVVAHPNGGVKEQVAGLYAQRLAEQGYLTIAADAAYQGASGGQPRNVDKPANRIEDIRGMADFVSNYPGVDKSRLGLLGICGGGGYSLKAAQTDKRFKSVATVSMFNSGRVRRNGYMDSQIATIGERLQQASQARDQEAAGGRVLYANDVQLTPEQIARLPFELYRQGAEYYGTTHAHPNSSGRYTLSSLLDLMSFDAEDQIALIDQPLLMVAGSKADSLYMSEEAFAKAAGTKDKELFLVEGATHIETYWVPKYVATAVEKLSGFYDRTLAAGMAIQSGHAAEPAAGQQITKADARTSIPANAKFFTGNARVDPLFTATREIAAAGAYVTFELGVRSSWHTHPAGQRLVVTAGIGRTQEWGKPVQEIRAGDVVVCPPGVKHWHGASPDSTMTHLAVTGSVDGKTVAWLEKVTDEQYAGN